MEEFRQKSQERRKGDDAAEVTPEALSSLDQDLDEIKQSLKEGDLELQTVKDALRRIAESAGKELFELPSVTKLDAVEEFVVGEKFEVGAKIGDLTIVRLAPNFRKHFLDVKELNVPARDLVTRQLTRGSRDAKIIEAMGQHFETHLAHHYRIIKMGVHGPAHITNGWMNLGYMRSPVDGEIKAVRWHVWDSGINIGIRSAVGTRGEGEDGPRVFGGDLDRA